MAEWRDAVRTEIVRYCDENETTKFDLQDLLKFSQGTLQNKFPDNDTWEASTRRTLQELRDKSEVEFLGNGHYQRKALNFSDGSTVLPVPDSNFNTKIQYSLTHYEEAKSESNWDHPVVSLINSELPDEFKNRLADSTSNVSEIQLEKLTVRGSSGTGRMANIPWIGIFDQRIADGPQDGLYVVYLFDSIQDKLFLTLNQGMNELRERYGLGPTKEILSKRAELLRDQLDLGQFEFSGIDLPSELLTGRNKFYGDSTVCYRSYKASEFPSEEELIIDLCDLVSSYQTIVESGYYESLLDSFDEENGTQYKPETGENETSVSTSESDNIEQSSPTIWIEKTEIADRSYKQDGQYKLGNAIMSPSRDKGGRKRYETMREADVGDLVLHLLQEQHQIVGISAIESDLVEDFEGPPTDRWTEEQQVEGGYLRWLSDYEGIEPHIHVYDDLLEKEVYREKLRELLKTDEKIFYDSRLSLNQGHYFTKCPDKLVSILAEESYHLQELLEERGYEFESATGLSPADTYGGIEEATEDIKTRLEQTDEIQGWPTKGIAKSIIQDWTKALRRANLIQGDVSSADQVKCEQIIQLYEEHADRLESIAESVESGTIENSNLTAGQVLFIASLRDLQEESGISPNINHVKFRQLLRGVHKGQDGDELVAPDKKPRETKTIERQLQNTGQLVFYGPPGTGKTYTAQRFARWWLNQQPGHAPSSNQLETVTFHPSFSYEDFLEGLTAEADDGAVEYNIKDGVFKRICRRAEQAYNHAKQNEDVDEPPRYVLIIDEINRGNLAQIFGETITLLEADKRLDQKDEVEITLSHSRDSFTVPPNLYVIGTMNTADRSIALVDAALRRRFRFISFPPNYTVLIDQYDEFDDLENVREVAQTDPNPYRSLVALSILALRSLNNRIVDTPDLGKGKQIGHSYLMGLEDIADVLDAWQYEILPLLEEYYFGQFNRIREELFEGGGDRLFHWEMEEIADFTADDLRRALASLESITLAEPETETDEDTVYTLDLLSDKGILEPGDELIFDESKVPSEADQPYDSSERFWRCEVTGKTGQSDSVRWLHNDEEYSFSGLAQTILEQVSEHTQYLTKHPRLAVSAA